VVLLLLVVAFVFLASGPTGSWVPFVSAILQGATLLMVLVAAGAGKRLWRFAVVLVSIALTASLALLIAGVDATQGLTAGINALLVGVAPVIIVLSLIRRPRIDLQTVLGVLCVYVLLGMLWAYVFEAIGELSSGPFFAQTSTANVADYLYFSFVTLTTVGYGDLTAVGGLGRALAVLEALFGQAYLVTVVALVVSQIGRRGNQSDDEGAVDAP
jgi:hypothetical protein